MADEIIVIVDDCSEIDEAIEEFNNNGIRGDEAGERLREAIKKAAQAMCGFGITAVDIKTFREAVQKLRDLAPDINSHDCRDLVKPSGYKPSQFPVKRSKKAIYKKLK